MDIVRFQGGLGNQMFQYAFLASLRSRGRDVYGSMDFYHKSSSWDEDAMETIWRPYVMDKIFENVHFDIVDDNVFENIVHKWGTRESINENGEATSILNVLHYFSETTYGTYCDDVYKATNCAYDGYWQTEKYFRAIRPNILHDFKFTHTSKELREYGDILQKEYVAIHVRRGDYIKFQYRCHICSKEYYEKAIMYMQKIFPDARFIIFSDDIDWCKDNFDAIVFEGKHIFDNYEDWFDMYLMTRCKGNIISNSSFAWWGAWLNQNKNQVVISPKIWYKLYNAHDVWCDDWIRM